MRELEYPFDGDYLLKKKKRLRRQLLENAAGVPLIDKKIAILCGSTANDIRDMLELFLLNQGIRPSFYLSEYNQYWQDVMFDNPDLVEFAPDIIYIHTSSRNISAFPTVRDSREVIDRMLEDQYEHFAAMWDKIAKTYHCPIIQNNFEQPFYRLLGNRDVSDIHGKQNFVHRLNGMFYQYAGSHTGFYIHDINFMASCYGLEKWSDPLFWHMYKYAMAVPAIPEFAYNLSNIIKSIYGKNKKALVLDLDNTLWGGIVGDDGADQIEIGQETPMGQIYAEFQSYLKEHKDLGIVLNVDSKNDEENALAGLNRPDSVLKPEDFLIIKANWEPKDRNLLEIAREINIGADSLVFVDDNPAERHIVASQVPGAGTPEIAAPETYIKTLDRSGFFEVTSFSEDDLKRNAMYQANAARKRQQASFADYSEYLKSLEMKAEIRPFTQMYLSRISQLTNKSNQFNLTTRRCSLSDIEQIAENPAYVTLYGKLTDKFGDNGVVTVVFGHQDGTDLHIDLWLMSCRVLKRNMEEAVLDTLAARCADRGIGRLIGYYYPTAKNKMVKDFYPSQGFCLLSQEADGSSVWELDLTKGYEKKNQVIEVEEA